MNIKHTSITERFALVASALRSPCCGILLGLMGIFHPPSIPCLPNLKDYLGRQCSIAYHSTLYDSVMYCNSMQ